MKEIGIVIDQAILMVRESGQSAFSKRDVLDIIMDNSPEIVTAYGRVLAIEAITSRITKRLKKSEKGAKGQHELAQLQLPGVEPPFTIRNYGSSEGEFVNVWFDRATFKQVMEYDAIPEKNIADASARRLDLNLKLAYLKPAFEHDPNFTVAEACRWLAAQEVAA